MKQQHSHYIRVKPLRQMWRSFHAFIFALLKIFVLPFVLAYGKIKLSFAKHQNQSCVEAQGKVKKYNSKRKKHQNQARKYSTSKVNFGQIRRFFIIAFCTFIFTLQFSGLMLWFVAPPAMAQSTTTLQIEPITWDFVGLDSNKPESQGPNTYVVGARVCNKLISI
jgi:cytochrome b subunit of formate dehydrogenase